MNKYASEDIWDAITTMAKKSITSCTGHRSWLLPKYDKKRERLLARIKRIEP